MDYSVPGFRIERIEENGSTLLSVEARERQAWRIADREAALCGEMRETTLEYRSENFRIVEEAATEAGWRYRCVPWPAGETRTEVVKLDAEDLRRIREEAALTRHVEKKSAQSAQYEIALGWLPSSVQRKLSHRLHFSPAEATRKNGLLEMFLGFGIFAPLALLSLMLPALLALWMILEGAARWIHGLDADSNGCGIFVLELPARLLEMLDKRRV